MKINDVSLYVGLVFGKLLSIWGAVATLTSLSLFFFGNSILPQVFPAFFLGTMLLLFTLMASGCLVWFDQLKLNRDNQKHIDELENRIPKFTVSDVKVFRYTVSRLIEEYKAELEHLEKQSRKEDEIQKQASGPLTNMFASMRIGFGGYTETTDEKRNRIKGHIKDLEVYEDKIKFIYRIALKYSSSRSATNIEISLSASKDVSLKLKDNYIGRHLPTTAARQTGGYMGVLPIGDYVHDFDMSSSGVQSGVAHSGVMKHINVGAKEDIFDNELYINTRIEKVELELKFASSELHETQTVHQTVNLKKAATVEVDEN